MSVTQPPLRRAHELLSSMRFAISLLTLISVASVIGTVLKQNQPYADYIIEFGAFWFAVFRDLGLLDVYHSAWFLVILVFLVVSTSLCVWRHTPVMLREMRSYRTQARETSLRLMKHSAAIPAGADALTVLPAWLSAAGWRYRRHEADGQVLFAAKRGSAHRLGYVFTHLAIVVICVGGLIDGNVPLKLRQLTGGKRVETRNIPESQVPATSRLDAGNLSFRGNVTIPEGSSAGVLFLDVGDGYMVQELPFTVALRKFRIDYYPTGQPKLFASDITVRDKATGRRFDATVSVNHPVKVDGVNIFQASFGDGGTRLKLKGWDLAPGKGGAFDFNGTVKDAPSAVRAGGRAWQVAFDDFRLANVENFGKPAAPRRSAMQEARDVLKADRRGDEDLRNLGPSVQFRVRDDSGQAHEYNNYILPVPLDGRLYYVSGVRGAPNEEFQYLRVPADEDGGVVQFMRLRALLTDPATHEAIARRFAAHALPRADADGKMRRELTLIARRVLDLFGSGGYDALGRFIEQRVPKAERQKAADTYLRILEGAAADAWDMARADLGKNSPSANEASARFLRDSLVAVSDTFHYGSPLFVQAVSFDPVLASGLQMTRAPGQMVVYLGCALLVFGVLAMFYVRERRLWVLVKQDAGEVRVAMASNRQTLELDAEFGRTCRQLTDLLKGGHDGTRA